MKEERKGAHGINKEALLMPLPGEHRISWLFPLYWYPILMIYSYPCAVESFHNGEVILCVIGPGLHLTYVVFKLWRINLQEFESNMFVYISGVVMVSWTVGFQLLFFVIGFIRPTPTADNRTEYDPYDKVLLMCFLASATIVLTSLLVLLANGVEDNEERAKKLSFAYAPCANLILRLMVIWDDELQLPWDSTYKSFYCDLTVLALYTLLFLRLRLYYFYKRLLMKEQEKMQRLMRAAHNSVSYQIATSDLQLHI
uniref:Uncharacterized protein n=1 Tax=Steinernema glaseri TaxID=37863 RepID=A0A1I8ANU4_9BILA